MTNVKFATGSLPDVLGQLTRHPLFAGVQQEALGELLVDGRIRRLEAQEFLFVECQDADAWWLILEGAVEAFRSGLDGEERIFGIFGSGDLVGEAAMFIPERRFPVSARARRDCRLCQFRRQDLRHLCECNAMIAVRLLEQTTRRLSMRVHEIDRLAASTAAQRLADYLLRQFSLQGEALELPLSQRQLAATLGVRAETLNRLLAEWLRAGYLAGARRSWQVRDAAALTRLAGRPGESVRI